MIDTIKIILSDSKILTNNKLTVIPASFEASGGLVINDYFLFVDSTNHKYTGSRAYYNDDKINVSILPKYELLKDKKIKDLFDLNLDDGNSKIFVQFSLPKFLNGNNFFPADLYQLKKHFLKLEKYLVTIGIVTNIFESTLSRIDSYINVKVKNNFKTYNEIFQNIKLSRLKNFEYAGTTFLYKNTLNQICIYDKKEELKNQQIELNISGNYIRIENRLLKKSKILNNLGYTSLEKLQSGITEIKRDYLENIESKILNKRIIKDIENKKILEKDKLTSYLLELKKTKGQRWLDYFFKSIGYLYLKDLNKLKNLDESLDEISTNKMQKSRFQNKLSDYNFNSTLLKQKGQTTNKQLFQEIKDSFYREISKLDY